MEHCDDYRYRDDVDEDDNEEECRDDDNVEDYVNGFPSGGRGNHNECKGINLSQMLCPKERFKIHHGLK